MNIFVTSPDPIESARNLDLKRVVKMILESYQLLSNALHLNGLTPFYKPTHLKHPCSLWVAESAANFEWLVAHVSELGLIYSMQYKRMHKCERERLVLVTEAIEQMKMVKPGPQTPFVNCTNFKNIEDVHAAYRIQMIEKWKGDKYPPKWYEIDGQELMDRWRA